MVNEITAIETEQLATLDSVKNLMLVSNHQGPIQITGVAHGTAEMKEGKNQRVYLAVYRCHGVEGRVRISAEQYDLLKSLFNFIQGIETPRIDQHINKG